MGYLLAWIVILLAAAGGTAALMLLTRGMAPGLLRNLVRFLPAVLLLVPAPIPGFGGDFAPAFVVLVFESVFQSDGRPFGALAIICAAAAIATLLVAFGSNALGGSSRARQRSDAVPGDAHAHSPGAAAGREPGAPEPIP
jgi:hypothetical protein